MLSAFWWLQKSSYINRPCPSSPAPLHQNEFKCSAFDMEMIFHSHVNKTHFHKKFCALGLILKVRVFGTRKWPPSCCFYNNEVCLAISQKCRVFCSVNPFSAKCGQGQNSTKVPKFCFAKFWKQIASFESTSREVSFEWSHHRILSTDSKVRTILRDSNIHSGSERVNERSNMPCWDPVRCAW